jgi:organic radical activating enzyme
MDSLLSKILNYNHVFIFGCGNVGQNIYKQLEVYNIHAKIHFCDNSKRGQTYLNEEILTPENAYLTYPDALFIIGSGIHHLPMLTQLKKIGVLDENIVAEWIETRSRMIPRTFINSVIYHLVEHCNLKCAGCLHFSNVAKECFADLAEFQKTFKRFVEVMGDAYQGSIVLLGGEPLLHPQIEQFIEAARRLTQSGTISILTNGLLLEKMPKTFWVTCAKCGVHLVISRYPINLNIQEIQKLADYYGIQLKTSSRNNNAWLQYVFDLDGKQNIRSSFANCENANECFIMKGKYLYNCNVTACIEHFNKAFGQNLLLQEEDYLDLHSFNTKQELLQFISTPSPFCRYCDRRKLKLGQVWRRSEFDIKEYLA